MMQTSAKARMIWEKSAIGGCTLFWVLFWFGWVWLGFGLVLFEFGLGLVWLCLGLVLVVVWVLFWFGF